MKDWKMYFEIQKLKTLGFKKTKVAKKLNINFRTVDKYWDMKPEEYQLTADLASVRVRKPDEYRTDMIDWLMKYPDMTTAQLYDWLEEKYQNNIRFSERTLRDYVVELRDAEKIPKAEKYRQHEAVEDPPMGYQAQVDMGQIWLRDEKGKKIQVYCFAMVLSHSRYKFVYWQTKPFTTASFITAHEKAFAFLGGRTIEIVYDQDKVLAVSENNGDIIYTEGFQNYISIMKFKVYLCRGSDPESKGRVEAVVKYAKYNFADHRIFIDIETFNDQCMEWLKRRGNGKKHEIIQKIPGEVFTLEKEYLIPVSEFRNIFPADILTYSVRKDNTVLYKSNRYRVPKGTYRPGLKVKLKIDGTTLIITDQDTGEIYARHTLNEGRGQLITLLHANRELNKKLPEVYKQVLQHFNNSSEAESYLLKIKEDRPRYFKDQLTVILRVCESAETGKLILEALSYCKKYSLYSASEFKAAAEYYKELNKVPERAAPKPGLPEKYKAINPKIRDINEYKRAMEG